MSEQGRKRLFIAIGAVLVIGACCLCSGLYLAWTFGDQAVQFLLSY